MTAHGPGRRALPLGCRQHTASPAAHLSGSSAGPCPAETEQPLDGDRWFWADDKAKILEFPTLPALWRPCQEEVAALFAFLQVMIEAPLILRRIGWPLLEAQGEAGKRPPRPWLAGLR
ncbi:MAG: hypothetical protein N2688_13065 [Burkholderiaceae bacterium]|nr:hypothetical protein [Burkholderiaceae bacterium]